MAKKKVAVKKMRRVVGKSKAVAPRALKPRKIGVQIKELPVETKKPILSTGGKYFYYFGGGKAEGSGAMKDILGGKGAGLAEKIGRASCRERVYVTV